ncbi:hypothetical protein LB505_014116 [Fusarium chuoi]|nr:hypothetical protein LB505_014116 [Fusarium chuoi]
MDKPTNSFNIAIAAINFINAIFLLIFSNVFGLPKIVVGVVGVVLFVLNAAFALILLLMLIVSTALVFFRKNPDARYQSTPQPSLMLLPLLPEVTRLVIATSTSILMRRTRCRRRV